MKSLHEFRHLCVATCVLLTLVLASIGALGQTDSSPAPALSGPLPAPASDYSHWVITYSYPDDKGTPSGASSGSRVRTITTTKTGGIIHEEVVDGTGAKSEEWYVGSTLYTRSPGAALWNEMKPGSGFIAFPASGYRNLDWVTKENYVGPMQLSNHTYLLFIPGRPRDVDLSNPAQIDPAVTYALLDSESRLPVKVQSAGSIRFYQFMAPPTQKLTLPADLTEQLKKAAEAEMRLNQRMPRPY